MSAELQLNDGDALSVPSHDLTVRDGGDRVRLQWWAANGTVRCRALFRVTTEGQVAILTALDCWPVSQRAVAAPDRGVTLDNIPEGLLLAIRGAGYTPTEEDN